MYGQRGISGEGDKVICVHGLIDSGQDIFIYYYYYRNWIKILPGWVEVKVEVEVEKATGSLFVLWKHHTICCCFLFFSIYLFINVTTTMQRKAPSQWNKKSSFHELGTLLELIIFSFCVFGNRSKNDKQDNTVTRKMRRKCERRFEINLWKIFKLLVKKVYFSHL